MPVTLEDLRLEKSYVVYPDVERYPPHERVETLPLVDNLSLELKLPYLEIGGTVPIPEIIKDTFQDF